MDEQPTLPGMNDQKEPVRIGRSSVSEIDAKSILTPASGFMSSYDYTLNPYSGCGFGCTYCYAAFFARDRERQNAWGEWVEIKRNALSLLEREASGLSGKSIYMSSVTDPYQPVERKLGLVRSLLEVMATVDPTLVVQTRGTLVTRDIDLFQRFSNVRVNMTVTTDSQEVQRAFEPGCPTTSRRLEAIRVVQAAGVDSAITLTPLLPLEDPVRFADALLDTGVERFVVQPFHFNKGRFVRGTREEAVDLARQMGWSVAAYEEAVVELKARLPLVIEGREGFEPPT